MQKSIQLADVSKRIRATIISTCFRRKGGHLASSLSAVEIFYALLTTQTNLLSQHDRTDRLIISSCQCALAFYATLLELSKLTQSDLDGFLSEENGTLGMFPRAGIPASDYTAGSLGHGISFGVGIALYRKRKQLPGSVFIFVGDGELQEGENWEALMAASHYNLTNIVVLVNLNHVQISGATSDVMHLGDVYEKFHAFGWDAKRANGHSIEDIRANLTKKQQTDWPTAIFCETVKGNGTKTTKSDPTWHYRVPNADEYRILLSELHKEVA